MSSVGWRIELLGGLRAIREGDDGSRVVIERFRSHATGGLLAHLAFQRGHKVAREDLIESLWPGCDLSAGRNRLSVALSSLRGALGDVFEGDRDHLCLLRAHASTDTAQMEEALRRASGSSTSAPGSAPGSAAGSGLGASLKEELSLALRLYRGPLLPEFEAEWIAPQRARLEELFFRALRRLAALHAEEGEWREAIAWAERGLGFDEAREDVARDLLRLLLQSRRLDAARRRARDIEKVLLDLDATPQAATRALIEQVEARAREAEAREAQASRAASQPASRPSVVNLPRPRTRFFGREDELKAGHEWLRLPGERLLTLMGAGGSGKTRLAIEMLRRLQEALAPTHAQPGDGAASAAPCATPAPTTCSSKRAQGKSAKGRRDASTAPTAGAPTAGAPAAGAPDAGASAQAAEPASASLFELDELFPGGVWWVALADVSDASLLLEEVRRALHRPASNPASSTAAGPSASPARGTEPLEDLLGALAARPALLALDNCEHLLPGGSTDIAALLEGAPDLKILATSRRKLHLASEGCLPVAPLSLPGPQPAAAGSDPGALATQVLGQPQPCDRQLQSPAVALFCDRARTARPGFELDEAGALSVAQLVRRMDGVPLAIELAAARVNVLSPREILEHLQGSEDARDEVLATRGTVLPPRHRSLRAAMEWSFRLLDPDLQRLWARLSLFRGGCCLEAAREVCGGQGILDALSLLRDHSLLVAEERPGEKLGSAMRFSLLETLREFAGEQLSDEERRHASWLHTKYFLLLAEKSEALLVGPQQEAWLERLDLERDNLRAALEWASHHEPEVALRLATAMVSYWERRGLLEEGTRQLGLALEQSNGLFDSDGCFESASGVVVYHPDWAPGPLEMPPAHWKGRALCEAGHLAWLKGDYEAARPLLERCVAVFERIGDEVAAAWPMDYLGLILVRQGQFEDARALFEKCLATGRATNQAELMAEAWGGLSSVAVGAGDMELLAQAGPEAEQGKRTWIS